jgi:hypothetical protein
LRRSGDGDDRPIVIGDSKPNTRKERDHGHHRATGEDARDSARPRLKLPEHVLADAVALDLLDAPRTR